MLGAARIHAPVASTPAVHSHKQSNATTTEKGDKHNAATTDTNQTSKQKTILKLQLLPADGVSSELVSGAGLNPLLQLNVSSSFTLSSIVKNVINNKWKTVKGVSGLRLNPLDTRSVRLDALHISCPPLGWTWIDSNSAAGSSSTPPVHPHTHVTLQEVYQQMQCPTPFQFTYTIPHENSREMRVQMPTIAVAAIAPFSHMQPTHPLIHTTRALDLHDKENVQPQLVPLKQIATSTPFIAQATVATPSSSSSSASSFSSAISAVRSHPSSSSSFSLSPTSLSVVSSSSFAPSASSSSSSSSSLSSRLPPPPPPLMPRQRPSLLPPSTFKAFEHNNMQQASKRRSIQQQQQQQVQQQQVQQQQVQGAPEREKAIWEQMPLSSPQSTASISIFDQPQPMQIDEADDGVPSLPAMNNMTFTLPLSVSASAAAASSSSSSSSACSTTVAPSAASVSASSAVASSASSLQSAHDATLALFGLEVPLLEQMPLSPLPPPPPPPSHSFASSSDDAPDATTQNHEANTAACDASSISFSLSPSSPLSPSPPASFLPVRSGSTVKKSLFPSFQASTSSASASKSPALGLAAKRKEQGAKQASANRQIQFFSRTTNDSQQQQENALETQNANSTASNAERTPLATLFSTSPASALNISNNMSAPLQQRITLAPPARISPLAHIAPAAALSSSSSSSSLTSFSSPSRVRAPSASASAASSLLSSSPGRLNAAFWARDDMAVLHALHPSTLPPVNTINPQADTKLKLRPSSSQLALSSAAASSSSSSVTAGSSSSSSLLRTPVSRKSRAGGGKRRGAGGSSEGGGSGSSAASSSVASSARKSLSSAARKRKERTTGEEGTPKDKANKTNKRNKKDAAAEQGSGASANKKRKSIRSPSSSLKKSKKAKNDSSTSVASSSAISAAGDGDEEEVDWDEWADELHKELSSDGTESDPAGGGGGGGGEGEGVLTPDSQSGSSCNDQSPLPPLPSTHAATVLAPIRAESHEDAEREQASSSNNGNIQHEFMRQEHEEQQQRHEQQQQQQHAHDPFEQQMPPSLFINQGEQMHNYSHQQHQLHHAASSSSSSAAALYAHLYSEDSSSSPHWAASDSDPSSHSHSHSHTDPLYFRSDSLHVSMDLLSSSPPPLSALQSSDHVRAQHAALLVANQSQQFAGGNNMQHEQAATEHSDSHSHMHTAPSPPPTHTHSTPASAVRGSTSIAAPLVDLSSADFDLDDELEHQFVTQCKGDVKKYLTGTDNNASMAT